MEILGYFGALFMGFTLGLMGGGGSILTVPILVYFFGKDAMTATGLSLFIVGISSASGLYAHQRSGTLSWRTALLFGSASLLSVFVARYWLVPALPDPLLNAGGIVLDKGTAILILFAILMLAASLSMIRKRSTPLGSTEGSSTNTYTLLIIGLLTGLLTGILGAGGGFLIVPALVLFAGTDMKKAVGTSLLIITVNSLVGFLSDRALHLADHINIIIPIILLAVIGIVIGSKVSAKVDSAQMRPIFGWFVLVMGTFIILREILRVA